MKPKIYWLLIVWMLSHTFLDATAQITEFQIWPSDAEASDWFGRSSLSLDGKTAIIGAQNDADNGFMAGAAYIFSYDEDVDNWREIEDAKLLAIDGGEYDQFGCDVAIYDDTVIIGASGDTDNGLDEETEYGAGAAYIFVHNGTTWEQQYKLLAPDGEGGDSFGRRVAIYGDTVVVGSHLDDSSGSAYVFAREGIEWTFRQKLTAIDGAADDFFGLAVSIWEQTVVVGAYGHSPNQLDKAGAVYIFVDDGSTWTLQDKLTALDADELDRFGISVSIFEDTTLIGSADKTTVTGSTDDPDNPLVISGERGSAYVFIRNGSQWVQQAKLTASDRQEGDRFGQSVSLFGDTAVIGAFRDDDPGLGEDVGSVYIFERSWNQWTESAKITPSNGWDYDYFGLKVSVSENQILLTFTNCQDLQF
jgi:hypothetical protein